ncbi:SpoIID/LytB domain-containing protein [Desulfobotulus sp. H1]|uniref:SpoIID/LytB domain-containing protein n=1 Tax=Desulfobotulus pelophilus TaxID=2823377 RepID=A0ABT3N930_9BACT|nr:SpoIID/LytB domain-containing protein [Desulfobotulus pelophilus]MCW7753972.1 SpoIID/LytB domain-containing protein [Desulfobotulus pelophilus]
MAKKSSCFAKKHALCRSPFLLTLFFLLIILRPSSAHALPEELSMALEEQRYTLAIHILRSWAAVSDSPDDRAKALWMEARIQALHMENTDEAAASLDRLLTAYPKSPLLGDARFEKAVLAMQSGRKEKAIQGFADFVTAFPDHPRRQSAGSFLRFLQGRQTLPSTAREGIRVALSLDTSRIQISGSALTVTDMVTDAEVCKGSSLILDTDRSGRIRINGRPTGQPLSIRSPDGSFLLNGRRHRGRLQVHSTAGHLLLVNVLDLESYLKGVVPAEMPPSWPEEALKAQAVAARTYALHHMEKRKYEPYDVKSDTRSQVFSTEREHPRSSAAVTATRGEVMVWAGTAAFTAFHADSGGHTEAADALWGKDYPYLTPIMDFWTRETPHGYWKCSFSERELRQMVPELRDMGRILDIRPEGTTPSGRVHLLVFRDSRQETTIPAGRFRTRVGPMNLKSTAFSINHERGVFHFQGKGFGHGVGMSQWGARKMAEAGRDYRDILLFYYPHLHWAAMEE